MFFLKPQVLLFYTSVRSKMVVWLTRRPVLPGVNRLGWMSCLIFWALAVSACFESTGHRGKRIENQLTTNPTRGLQLPGAWKPSIRIELIKLIERHGRHSDGFDPADPPIAVFDFDHTCIHGDIGKTFYDWMIRNDNLDYSQKILDIFPNGKGAVVQTMINRLNKHPPDARAKSKIKQELLDTMHQIYWNLCDDPRFDKCFPWQVRFYAGWQPKQIADMAERVMRTALSLPVQTDFPTPPNQNTRSSNQGGSIRIYNEIRTLITTMKQAGFQVWIVSAGPQWVVEGAARFFDVVPPFVIGMRTKIVQSRITTHIDPPPTYKQGKVAAIRRYIGKQPLLAVGDSWSDAEMLMHAEHGLLIDRGSPDLRQKAEESSWWIQPSFPVE